jgi:hypothetical protein
MCNTRRHADTLRGRDMDKTKLVKIRIASRLLRRKIETNQIGVIIYRPDYRQSEIQKQGNPADEAFYELDQIDNAVDQINQELGLEHDSAGDAKELEQAWQINHDCYAGWSVERSQYKQVLAILNGIKSRGLQQRLRVGQSMRNLIISRSRGPRLTSESSFIIVYLSPHEASSYMAAIEFYLPPGKVASIRIETAKENLIAEVDFMIDALLMCPWAS